MTSNGATFLINFDTFVIPSRYRRCPLSLHTHTYTHTQRERREMQKIEGREKEIEGSRKYTVVVYLLFLDRQGHNSRMNQCFLDRTGPHHPSAFLLLLFPPPTAPWHRLCRPLSRPPPRRAIRVERAEQPSGLNLHQRIYPTPPLSRAPSPGTPFAPPPPLAPTYPPLGQPSLSLSSSLRSFPRLRGRTLCSQLLGKGRLPLDAHTPRRQGVVASAR